ncbi:bifunctional diguanylate cyclase/phosphodiesterase [Algibacillus agarilyticus]|uniref:bifunctional diguanylate cyclase/phosphodiesterase n=1 Tax=Algibacillus agarilyticus TaxID=2234133 RepID=UPI0018E578D9|nr:EAL domain-containing protein [Algibacillus agarilyticus]
MELPVRASRSKLVSTLYKRAKSVQAALMQVSELASHVTDINDFYPQAHQIVTQLMAVPNFYIVFRDPDNRDIKVAYFSDEHQDETCDHLLVSSLFEYGLTGWVVRNNKPLLCNPENKKQLLESGQITQVSTASHSWLGVPLLRNDKAIGALVIQSYDCAITFNPRDTNVLQFVADHIIHAIDRVKQKQLLESEIQRQTLELKRANYALKSEIQQRKHYEKVQNALIEISEQSCASLSLAHFYKNVHEILARLIHADNFYVAQLTDDNHDIFFPYYQDTFTSKPNQRAFAHGMIEFVIRSGEAQLFDHERLMLFNLRGEVAYEPTELHQLQAQGFTAWLGAPLVIDDKVAGVIAVQSYKHGIRYQKEDIEIIRYVANHIGLAIFRIMSQQALTRSNEELERIVNARTQALYNVNQDLFLQIEERKKIEAKLYHEAHHDTLTGLPNRAFFSQALRHKIVTCSESDCALYFVLFIDLDRFKIINDTFGHHVGDEFLVQVSQRIASCLQKDDLLARLGGDEFVILLNSALSLKDAETIAAQIVDALTVPFTIQGNELYAGSSIGLTSSLHNYTSSTDVLRDADAAMYEAKNLGRGCYVVFDESLHQALVDKLSLETELRRALKQEQVEFAFQPIVDFSKQELLAVEALARWQHPTRGLLLPDDFMALAEETGVIFDIDMLALKAAILIIQSDTFADEKTLVAVNISGRIIQNNSQLKAVVALLDEANIDNSRLVLEFSENTLADYASAIQVFALLKKVGVKVALDDFGAGSGSMNILFSAVVDFVKIDKQVVAKLPVDEKIQNFTDIVLQIGKTADYRVIAEGVESAQEFTCLQNRGCQFGQGRYFQSAVELVSALDTDPEGAYGFSIARKLAI